MSIVERIVVAGEVYEAKSAADLWESELTNQIVARAADFLPEWLTVRFTSDVVAEDYGRRRPDLALIDRGYRTWHVIEVELTSHSLHDHVIPQVEVFKFGRYVASHADHMLATNGNAGLERARLRSLVQAVQPEVTVIAEQELPEWRLALTGLDVGLLVFRPYQNDLGRWAYRLGGDLPTTSRMLTLCEPERAMGRMLRLLSPTALRHPQGAELAIRTAAGSTRWRVVRSDTTAFLLSIGAGYPLNPRATAFALTEDDRARFALEERTSQRRRGR